MQPKPRLENYQTLEAYLEALVEWHLERRFDAIDRAWLPGRRRVGGPVRAYVRAIAGGWPGLLLFLLIMLVAWTLGDR